MFLLAEIKNGAADSFVADAAVIIIIIILITRGCSAVSALNQQTRGKHSEQRVKLMLHRISSIAEVI